MGRQRTFETDSNPSHPVWGATAAANPVQIKQTTQQQVIVNDGIQRT